MRRRRGRKEVKTLAPARQSRLTCVFLLFLSVLGGLRESPSVHIAGHDAGEGQKAPWYVLLCYVH